jgi:hypothetical protein
MPVEDRLRQGLEANATSFTPHEQELRLEQVHRRGRRHDGVVAASLGVAAALLAAVVVQVVPGWPGSTPPIADAPRRSSSDPVERVAAVPAGGWVREVTAKKGLALGISRRRVERLTGEDGAMGLGLKLQEQQVFTLWTNDDDGLATAWDTGRYAFTSGHRLVLTSMSSKCPGCVTRLTWSEDGKDLVLSAVRRDTAPLVARWLWEGRWDYPDQG